MYMYHLLKVKLLLVLCCTAAHLKIKGNTDKFYEHKIDIFKAPVLSMFKIFPVFYSMIYTIRKIYLQSYFSNW